MNHSELNSRVQRKGVFNTELENCEKLEGRAIVREGAEVGTLGWEKVQGSTSCHLAPPKLYLGVITELPALGKEEVTWRPWERACWGP